MAATLAQKELQADGTGNYAMVALLIIAVYGTEFYCFFRSLSGLSIPFLTAALYAIVNVFGFEICWALAEDSEEDA